MTEQEQNVFHQISGSSVDLKEPTWEKCRSWLKNHDWKVNVLSDYPGGEIRFTVRQGFQRIEVMGKSDLEVMGKAILEISRREKITAEG